METPLLSDRPRPRQATPAGLRGRITSVVVAVALVVGLITIVGAAAVATTATTTSVATGSIDASGDYTAVAPTRIVDTRDGTGLGGSAGPVGDQGTLRVRVVGVAGVPVSGVAAVVVNVTETEATAPSYLTVWPTGSPRPTTSVSNFVAGQTRASLVMTTVGADGTVSVYNHSGAVHVVIDIVGWYATTDGQPGSRFHSVTPVRILDTRDGAGAIGPRRAFTVTAAGAGGVPADGVTDVVVNI